MTLLKNTLIILLLPGIILYAVLTVRTVVKRGRFNALVIARHFFRFWFMFTQIFSVLFWILLVLIQ